MLILSNGKVLKCSSGNEVVDNTIRSSLEIPEMLNDDGHKILNHEPIGICHCEVCEGIREREKNSIRISKEEYEDIINTIEKLKSDNNNLLKSVNNAYNKIANNNIANQSVKNKIKKMEQTQLNDIIDYMNSPEMVTELYNLRSVNRDMCERINELTTELDHVKSINEYKYVESDHNESTDKDPEILIPEETELILSKYYNYLKDLLSSSIYSSKTSNTIKDGSIGICIYFNNEFIKEESYDKIKTEINAGNGYFGMIIRYDENNDNFVSRAGVIVQPEEIEYYIPLPQEIQDLFIR